MGLTQIIVTEMVLGLIFKKLYVGPLFWMNIIISSALIALTLSINTNGSSFTGKVLNELIEKTGGFFRLIRSDIILIVLFSLMVIKICWLMFIGYLFPSYTWDSLSYHLPIVGNIMQVGAIIENSANFQIDTFINIFPKNMELFFLWNIIFLKNSSITDLSQLPFMIMGILTTYSIALKLSIREKSALYASSLFFFTPILILQINTNYIDISVSVLLLTVINFLLYESPYVNSEFSVVDQQENRKYPLLLAGLTAGILLGSKGSGPLLILIISIAIIVQEFLKHRRQTYTREPLGKGNIIKCSILPYIIYFLIPIMVLGGYWFTKNWLLYGSPVYPMEVTVFNITIFKGIYKKMLDPVPSLIENSSYFIRLFHVWTENVEFYLYDSRLSGLGPLWFILLLPSLIFTFIHSIIKKQYNWLFVIVLLMAIFAVHPRNWNTRYTIFMVSLAAVSYGYVIDYFGTRKSITGIIALALGVYTFLTVNSPCVMPEKIREFMDLPANERTIARHKPFNIDIHVNKEYGYWIWIGENVEKGDTVAYTFEPLFLTPLWNDGFSSKIMYVGSNDYDEWLNIIKDRHVTYLLLRKDSKEDGWIEENSKALSGIGAQKDRAKEEFKMVYSDDSYKIMKIVKAEES